MKQSHHKPPRLARMLLEWIGRNTSLEDLHGDLAEIFSQNLHVMSPMKAKKIYWRHVLSLSWSYAVKKRNEGSSLHPYSNLSPLSIKSMFANNFKITRRSITHNKFASVVNIGGLGIGMAVAILIGLWIWDEISFNRIHTHYDHMASVKEQGTYNGQIHTGGVIPMPLEAELRASYAGDFKYIVMSTIPWSHVLSNGKKNISFTGSYIGQDAPSMLSLHMIQGSPDGLRDPASMFIARSVAKAMFGDANPIGEVIRIDNDPAFKVAGVYEDLPVNSSFHEVTFMAPWEFYKTSADWITNRAAHDWSDSFLLMYVQVADGTTIATISEKIKNVKLRNVNSDLASVKPALLLHPMSKWHLYAKFTNGVNTGGAIDYVWMFGIVGVFVLLLACINFMNLSTARSEKRAKETGIRKVIGSRRSELVIQFYHESFTIALIAFVFSILMVRLALPFFNEVAGKDLSILWGSPLFWIASLGFTVFTALVAGSYPALYLSSFRPVEVLKGTFKAGRFATVPRSVLVIVQFTASIILIVGTIIVFRQIEFGKSRAVGYSRDGLIYVETSTDDLRLHFEAAKTEMMKSGIILGVAQSSSPTTGVNNNRGDVSWKGKDPAQAADFANIRVTMEYGKTVGWQFTSGRDFTPQFVSDSSGLVLNESAVHYMSLQDPVGEIIRVGKKDRRVVGVIKDMIMSSPYEPVKPTLYYVSPDDLGYIIIRINPDAVHASLSKIESVCKIYSPAEPFNFRFADEEYARKFSNEERIGKLAGVFSLLAILVSCIGLFGMATFMAEQRIKEIGIRKVLGASVFSLWQLMSGAFLKLTLISLAVAIPMAWYVMTNWLKNFNYHTTLSPGIFALVAAGTILVTLLTVGYQSIKAALANPVESLRVE